MPRRVMAELKLSNGSTLLIYDRRVLHEVMERYMKFHEISSTNMVDNKLMELNERLNEIKNEIINLRRIIDKLITIIMQRSRQFKR